MKKIYDIAIIRDGNTTIFDDSFGERELADKVTKYLKWDKAYCKADIEVVERDLIEDMGDMFSILASGKK